MSGLGNDPASIVAFARTQIAECGSASSSSSSSSSTSSSNAEIRPEFELAPSITVPEAAAFLGGAHVSSGNARVTVLLLDGKGNTKSKAGRKAKRGSSSSTSSSTYVDEAAAPGWLKSVAMHFKVKGGRGRRHGGDTASSQSGQKKVSFGYAPPSAAPKLAARLKLRTAWLPKIVVVTTSLVGERVGENGNGDENASGEEESSVRQEFAVFPGNLGPGLKLKTVKAALTDFIGSFVAGGGGAEGRRGTLPEELRIPVDELREVRAAAAAPVAAEASPQADVAELTVGNTKQCFSPAKGKTCVLIAVNQHTVVRDLSAARDLARRFAADPRDPFTFFHVLVEGGDQNGANGEEGGEESEKEHGNDGEGMGDGVGAFLSSFGVRSAPSVVVVKTGRRKPRYVAWAPVPLDPPASSRRGLLDAKDAGAFLEEVLGGSKQFTSLAALPVLSGGGVGGSDGEL